MKGVLQQPGLGFQHSREEPTNTQQYHKWLAMERAENIHKFDKEGSVSSMEKKVRLQRAKQKIQSKKMEEILCTTYSKSLVASRYNRYKPVTKVACQVKAVCWHCGIVSKDTVSGGSIPHGHWFKSQLFYFLSSSLLMHLAK